MNEPIVSARNLKQVFQGPDRSEAVALRDLTLDIRAGELTALVGPDGAGKTSFMRCCAGLLRPQSGGLHVLGLDVLRQPQKVQDRISYMPQRFGLYEDLSVQENLDLYADLHGVPMEQRRTRFGRMLEMTDMARFTRRPAGKLSGGMKQKLGLACTLVRSPDLLLLDEPSVGVDPLSRRDLWSIVEQLVADEGLTVIVSTAYMDEAERCAQVVVMDRGRQLAKGTPAELTRRAEGLTYRTAPHNAEPARALQERLLDLPELVIDAMPQAGQVRFIRQPGAATADLRAALAPCGVHPRRAELEDAFMMMLHQSAEMPDPASRPATRQQFRGDDGPVIVVRDLLRKFADFTAVSRTSFDVRRGEIFGLLGPNGAGKTTTFRMLCGLLPATGGTLHVAGHDLRKARAKARARIGYVAQKFALYGTLSVQENLTFFGGAYGLRGRALSARVAAMTERFDLDPRARAGALPVGFKQRLAMAAGLLHDPEILFLDEPTSGIDPLARRAFWRSMTALSHSGVTIVITTHFMEEAEYCDRIAIQDAGEMLIIGTPAEIRAKAAHGAGEAAAATMNEAFIAVVEQSRSDRRAAA